MPTRIEAIGSDVRFYKSDGDVASIPSENRRYHLVFQEDGNLVLYMAPPFGIKQAIWSSNTAEKGKSCYFQTDGNLVIYTSDNQHPDSAIWSTNTSGHLGAYIDIQDDGNVVMYYNGQSIWSTNTSRGD